MTEKPLALARGAASFALLAVLAVTATAQPSTNQGAGTLATSAAKRPNIIFILADDLGYGDLGSYGQKQIQTPHLDRLAAEGMRFTQFYAGSTVCAPSRCALMTGLHTGHCLIRGNAKVPLRPQDVTVAEVLKEAGYRTGLIGKWGLGNENTTGLPHLQGFNEFVGYLDQTHAHDYYPDHLWRYDDRILAKGSPDSAPVASCRVPMPIAENQENAQKTYSHDLFAHASIQFVRVNKPDQFSGHRPFFLFLSYTIPHANNEEGRRSGNGMQVPSDAPYSDRNWPQPEKNKAAMITRMDSDIGRLMDVLQKLKLDENTIVFFTSDNGPHREGGVDPRILQSSGPLRGIKRDLYEGGIRVPLIARWPGVVPAASGSDAMFAFWDFLPTAAELAGAKPAKGLDGISFVPTLLGKEQTNRHDFLYWEFHERGFQQAARMENWKAVRNADKAPLELYDLQMDPSEKEDVAANNPEIVKKFEAFLASARTESDQWNRKQSAERAKKR